MFYLQKLKQVEIFCLSTGLGVKKPHLNKTRWLNCHFSSYEVDENESIIMFLVYLHHKK